MPTLAELLGHASPSDAWQSYLTPSHLLPAPRFDAAWSQSNPLPLFAGAPSVSPLDTSAFRAFAPAPQPTASRGILGDLGPGGNDASGPGGILGAFGAPAAPTALTDAGAGGATPTSSPLFGSVGLSDPPAPGSLFDMANAPLSGGTSVAPELFAPSPFVPIPQTGFLNPFAFPSPTQVNTAPDVEGPAAVGPADGRSPVNRPAAGSAPQGQPGSDAAGQSQSPSDAAATDQSVSSAANASPPVARASPAGANADDPASQGIARARAAIAADPELSAAVAMAERAGDKDFQRRLASIIANLDQDPAAARDAIRSEIFASQIRSRAGMSAGDMVAAWATLRAVDRLAEMQPDRGIADAREKGFRAAVNSDQDQRQLFYTIVSNPKLSFAEKMDRLAQAGIIDSVLAGSLIGGLGFRFQRGVFAPPNDLGSGGGRIRRGSPTVEKADVAGDPERTTARASETPAAASPSSVPGVATGAGQVVDVGPRVAAAGTPSPDALTGQWHHGISTPIFRELDNHPSLGGIYSLRDPRFVTQAKDRDAHWGYQGWHRVLDREISRYLYDRKNLTQQEFESYLRDRYAQPDLTRRFPNGF